MSKVNSNIDFGERRHTVLSPTLLVQTLLKKNGDDAVTYPPAFHMSTEGAHTAPFCLHLLSVWATKTHVLTNSAGPPLRPTFVTHLIWCKMQNFLFLNIISPWN